MMSCQPKRNQLEEKKRIKIPLRTSIGMLADMKVSAEEKKVSDRGGPKVVKRGVARMGQGAMIWQCERRR